MNRQKLLWASVLTLIVAGIGFGVRAGLLNEWGKAFGFTQTDLGTITGGGLTGFGVVILLASLFLDKFGYKPFLMLAGVLHILSVVLTVAATFVYKAQVESDIVAAQSAAYFCLFWGVFLFGIANGICEAVINPLVATLFSKEKTHYLNILHAGWPAGLVLGSLLGIALIGKAPWEVVLSLYIVPTLLFMFLIFKEEFPKSEAAVAGVSLPQMLKEFAAPVLLLLLFLHACIGYVELGTDSWISNIMNMAFPGKGLWLFIYTSLLMVVLRFFAGPIVHRINPLGLLFSCAIFAVIGLTCLGTFETGIAIIVAATIYALGKTFFWPTMLGVVSEQFPRGGALTLGAIGGIGMLSAGLLGGPGIGYTQDRFASEDLRESAPALYEEYAAIGTNHFLFFGEVQGLDGSKVAPIINKAQADPETLTDDENSVKDSALHGGRIALRVTAAVPAIMALGFLILLFYYKSQGGYKAVVITSED
jgi:MFS family permease